MALRPAEMQKCFKVTDLVKGQCTFYNSTALSSKEQVPNAIIIEHFKPLFSSSCSPYAWILVCSTFLPFCFSSHRQVRPCDHLCLAVKSSCIHHFCLSNIAWLCILNCSKTAISSSSLYFFTLVINIAFSYLCPYVVVISIFFVLQFTVLFNTGSHPCSFITFIMFSCFSAFNFTLGRPSIISMQSTTYIKWCKCHFSSPHSTAITYAIIIINTTIFTSTISNTNTYSALFLQNFVCPFTRTLTEQLYTPYQIFVNIKWYFL